MVAVMAAQAHLYTKTQVRKAGRVWARFLVAHRERGLAAFDEFPADAVVDADAVISWWRDLHAYPLRMVNANLRHYVWDYDSNVTQRLKKHATIVSKLIRESTMDLTRMEDIGGCRVTLPTQQEVNEVVRRLRKNWNRSITRHRDYVSQPKSDGYRAHHLIVERKGCKIEVQIRTKMQDFWANTVEYDSRVVHLDLKSGVGPDDVQEYYRAMSKFLAHGELGTEPPPELRDQLVDLYARVAPFLTGKSTEPSQ